ncbi:MAG: orotate phosphoribosyltransferase [bacterium]
MDVMKLLEEKGAILNGHFLLSSGLHSKRYIQMAKVLQYPNPASFLGKGLAEIFKKDKIDIVLSPALGGITIGYEVARHLNKRAIFSERRDGKMGLFRGFEIKEKENVLIIEDVFTTGKTIKELIELIDNCKANITGIGVVIDRGQRAEGRGQRAEIRSLIRLNIETYRPEECPLCKEGIPFIKPGSR